MNSYIAALSDGIRATHNCECAHAGTSHVHEQMDGETVWEGDVEIFDLEGHPEATKAFAWGWDVEGEVRCLAIINVPPIESPREAVQAAIASGKFR